MSQTQLKTGWQGNSSIVISKSIVGKCSPAGELYQDYEPIKLVYN